MAEVDAQTVRDATTARIEAEQATETAQEAQWDAEAARSRLDGMDAALQELSGRVEDTEVVQAGIVGYLVEERQQPEAEAEHTEVAPRSDADPKGQPEPEAESEERGGRRDHGDRPCGTLW